MARSGETDGFDAIIRKISRVNQGRIKAFSVAPGQPQSRELTKGGALCEALDLRAGQKVLDVAAGNGNVTLAAARRWCEVVSTDYVPALLERGRERATAERLAIEFRQADAEALPFADASFDVVVSTFGVMFTSNQDKAATELLRVC